MINENQIVSCERLKGKISLEILIAPKIGSKPKIKGEFFEAHEMIINCFGNYAAGKPWSDSLALAAFIMVSRQYDVYSIHTVVSCLHAGFTKLFPALKLKTMDEWNPDIHLPIYLRGEVLPDTSKTLRASFSGHYNRAATIQIEWFQTLSKDDQKCYERFLMPRPNPLHYKGIVSWKEIMDEQRQSRKDETNAIVPYYPQIRSEAYLRYNKIGRIHQAYLEAIQKVKSGEYDLPFSFSYDEGGDIEREIPAQERLHFKVWDRRTIILKNQDRYSSATVRLAKGHKRGFSDESNKFYLEYVGAERLIGVESPEGIWFEELFKKGLVSKKPGRGSKEEVSEKQRLLRSWGYGEPNSTCLINPFKTSDSGILFWGSIDAQFISHAQQVTDILFIPIESLKVAATFGLLAINIFTTTGARMNEALQIRLDEKGLVRLEMSPPPEAKDQSIRIRYALRMIPKGERTEKLALYFIGPETERLIEKCARLLAEHYNLTPAKGEKLPIVAFHHTNHRSHRFGPARYLFQYNRKQLGERTITSCMRFLLHGLIFTTTEGKRVVIKAHLLRHAFATYAVQIEKVHIDVVREILHQKDIGITEYYSQVTENMVAEANEVLLARLASHINIKQAILRSPEEWQQQYDEAIKQVGTLTEVPGGVCTCHAICPVQMKCIGCAFKAPDPAKRYQVEEKKNWAEERLKRSLEEGLTIDAEIYRDTIRKCDIEFMEMGLIEAYRKDEGRVPLIQIKPLQK